LAAYLERVKAQGQIERQRDQVREPTQWPSEISVVTPYLRPELSWLFEARKHGRAFDAVLFIAALCHVHVTGGSRRILDFLMAEKCPVSRTVGDVATMVHDGPVISYLESKQ
jgi:hypothetical protein